MQQPDQLKAFLRWTIPGLFFHFFSSVFVQFNYTEKFSSQQELNSDRQSINPEHCPLEHHNGSKAFEILARSSSTKKNFHLMRLFLSSTIDWKVVSCGRTWKCERRCFAVFRQINGSTGFSIGAFTLIGSRN